MSAATQPVVLVVEDEALVRFGAADIITGLGAIAIEAADADVALEVLGNRPNITVLFTDVNMPGSMDG